MIEIEKNNKIYKSISVIAIFVLGFLIGFLTHSFTDNSKKTGLKSLGKEQKAHFTSVAINENQQLMIINRNTGNFQLYQDSVAQMILHLYVNHLYQKQ